MHWCIYHAISAVQLNIATLLMPLASFLRLHYIDFTTGRWYGDLSSRGSFTAQVMPLASQRHIIRLLKCRALSWWFKGYWNTLPDTRPRTAARYNATPRRNDLRAQYVDNIDIILPRHIFIMTVRSRGAFHYSGRAQNAGFWSAS